MRSKHLTRRDLFKLTGAVALGAAASQLSRKVSVLAHGDPTEADLEIRMGEFYFKLPDGEENAPIEVEAGKELILKVVNEGNVVHELHIGRDPNLEERYYNENLFGAGGDHAAHGFLGVHLEPGQVAYLHLIIPKDKVGEWEIGCLIEGHYEAGQRAPFIVKS